MKNKILKISICFLLVTYSVTVIGQSTTSDKLNRSVLISDDGFYGTLFQENYVFDLSPDKSGRFNVNGLWFMKCIAGDSISVWTPAESEIKMFEKRLYDLVINHRTDEEYINDNIPEIVECLSEYKRQYIGFRNGRKHNCIWIQFIRTEEILNTPDTSIERIFGGGSSVFLIIYNFRKDIIEHLSVNGSI
ncbi:MAG: hypothetical protein N4A72_08305 [Bacteroidales bacterium]|nr:hypothetical protein [Bacteroidales bacterium]